MFKNKKIIFLLVSLILSAALFAGCSRETVDDNSLGENQIVPDNNGTTDEDVLNQSEEGIESDLSENEDVLNQPEEGTESDLSETSETSAVGTLIAVDSESITISDEEGEELVLTITSDTEIQIGDTDSTIVDLLGKIGSEVSAEFDETKTVTTVDIKE